MYLPSRRPTPTGRRAPAARRSASPAPARARRDGPRAQRTTHAHVHAHALAEQQEVACLVAGHRREVGVEGGRHALPRPEARDGVPRLPAAIHRAASRKPAHPPRERQQRNARRQRGRRGARVAPAWDVAPGRWPRTRCAPARARAPPGSPACPPAPADARRRHSGDATNACAKRNSQSKRRKERTTPPPPPPRPSRDMRDRSSRRR
eukprot:scaffold2550_cov272-Prasinococcus_capsulatus_cf.AAC.5